MKKTYVWSIIFADCILVILILVVMSINKFNPNKDVCEEYGVKDITLYPNECDHFTDLCWVPSCKSGTYAFSARDRFEYEHCEKANVFTGYKCTKHKPKTKCELNPNDKDCVCDEYAESKYSGWYIAKRYNNKDGGRSFEDLTKEQYRWLINYSNDSETYSFELHTDVIEGQCIKAHEANECEKGNPNYIFDYECPDNSYWVETVYGWICCSYDNGQDTFCEENAVVNKTKKICRRKTEKEKCEEEGGTLNFLKGLNLVREIDDEVCIIPK